MHNYLTSLIIVFVKVVDTWFYLISSKKFSGRLLLYIILFTLNYKYII